MKLVFLGLICSLLWSFSTQMKEKDKSLIKSKYLELRESHMKNMPEITDDMFVLMFDDEIFQAVFDIKEVILSDHNGLAFRCSYTLPHSKEVVPAIIKLMHDSTLQGMFNTNLTWARLTSVPFDDENDPGQGHEFYLENTKTKSRARANFKGTPLETAKYISPFYEMVWIEVTGETPAYLNVLVTGDGLQNLSTPMFQGDFKGELPENTDEFLRIYHETCVGVGDISSKHVLHGNIKLSRVLLRVGEDHLRHPAISSFQHRGIWLEDFNGFDTALRYAQEYRAPTIEHFKKMVKVKSVLEPGKFIDRMGYYYSPDMREDTFALMVLFEHLVEVNGEEIDQQDQRIITLLKLIHGTIHDGSFDLFHVSTPSEWAYMVGTLIDKDADLETLVNQYLTFPQSLSEQEESQTFRKFGFMPSPIHIDRQTVTLRAKKKSRNLLSRLNLV